MTVALAMGQQVILFLNRRGTATFIMCRDCGHVVKCRQCDVPLSYHEAEDDLVCHHCGRRALVPRRLPPVLEQAHQVPGHRHAEGGGGGAPRLPQAPACCAGTATSPAASWPTRQILDRFAAHQADVLVGTQMIAKGLDLPLVTLVGVVSRRRDPAPAGLPQRRAHLPAADPGGRARRAAAPWAAASSSRPTRRSTTPSRPPAATTTGPFTPRRWPCAGSGACRPTPAW